MRSWVRFAANIACEAVAQVARLLPIKWNRVVFISHRDGSQYSDSPYYISEYLRKNHPGEIEIIWIFKNPGEFAQLRGIGIRLVRFHSLADFWYANTARVYVTNLFGPQVYVVPRRKKLIIETTHGVAYKSLLSNRVSQTEVGSIERILHSRSINRCNLALSGNAICTDAVLRGELGYEGEILQEGLPRNDVYFSDTAAIREDVCQRLGIDPACKVALVMPTWRKDNSRANVEIDYAALRAALEDKTGSRWVFVLRLHHLSDVDVSDILADNKGHMFEATHGFSSQEVLCTGDLLITDFSSVIWDFALRHLPILIFAPDLEAYGTERGFNVPPAEWGLYRASTTDELVRIVRDRSWEKLREATMSHLERFGCFETGHATEAVCARIVDFVEGERGFS